MVNPSSRNVQTREFFFGRVPVSANKVEVAGEEWRPDDAVSNVREDVE
jgi:hypothetical protein